MNTLKCQKILSSIVLVFFMESIAFSSGSIQGTITDTSSNPVSSAVVIAWQGGESKGTDTTSYVSGDGAYLISGLTAGTYELRVRVKGYEYRRETGVVVVTGSNIEASAGSIVITGIVEVLDVYANSGSVIKYKDGTNLGNIDIESGARLIKKRK